MGDDSSNIPSSRIIVYIARLAAWDRLSSLSFFLFIRGFFTHGLGKGDDRLEARALSHAANPVSLEQLSRPRFARAPQPFLNARVSQISC